MIRSAQSIIILVVILGRYAWCDDFEWNFEDAYQDGKLYVHALINYQFHPLWQFEWEKHLLNSNGLRLSTGSVTTDKLLIDGELNLNQELGSGWRFQTRGTWRENRHQNTREQSIFMGLEKVLSRGLSLYLLGDPRFDKEFMDAQFGAIFSDTSREKYLNIALILEDIVYDSKNQLEGKSTRKPYSVEWHIRYGKAKWWFYSDGQLSSGFRRIYPDRQASPELTFHRQRINDLTIKLYYQTGDRGLIQVHFYHYNFQEAKSFVNRLDNYDYENRIYDLSAEYHFSLNQRHRLRLLSHYLIQDASSLGYRQHDYERQEIFPAIFYEYHWSNHILETGFMFSIHNWEYQSMEYSRNYRIDRGYFDKIYLGYTYNFKKNARLHISISHQISVGGFGGANVQYQMFF